MVFIKLTEDFIYLKANSEALYSFTYTTSLDFYAFISNLLIFESNCFGKSICLVKAKNIALE